MKLKKRFLKRINIEELTIFLAVFFTSFIGAQIFGVSINKIALLPLEVYLICKCTGKGKLNRTQKSLLVWYIFSVLSALIGILYISALRGKNEKLFLYIIQVVVIYIPLIFLSGFLKNPAEIVKRTLVFTAKINAIWGLVQFLFWYKLKIDINDLLFNEVFDGAFGNWSTPWNFEAGTLAIRVSGFNGDSAFFASILIMGFCLSNSKLWKCLFCGMCVLSMSRTGIVVIGVIILGDCLKMKRKVSAKAMLAGLLTTLIAIIACIVAYTKVPSIKYQVDYAIFRLGSIVANVDVGTSRHMLYPTTSLRVWLEEFSLLRKLFGAGPRVGGIAFSESPIANTLMVMGAKTAWAIECDIAEILMGHGLLGITIYYTLFRLFKFRPEFRKCIFAILIIGFMYNILEITLFQIFIILISASFDHPIKKKCIIQEFEYGEVT